MEDREKPSNVSAIPESWWSPLESDSHTKVHNRRLPLSTAVIVCSALVAVVAVLYLSLF